MTLDAPRLVLITPIVTDAEAFRPELAAALQRGGIASLVLRLGSGDERSLINRVKALAPSAQARDCAVLVAILGAPHANPHDIAQIATRGGADGVHIEDADELRRLRERYRDSHIIGAGRIDSRHAAMQAGEAGADYVMFGEPDEDGVSPALATVLDAAHWWADIFETPCIAVSPTLADVPEVARTGAEFLGLCDAVWSHEAGPDEAIREALARLGETADMTP